MWEHGSNISDRSGSKLGSQQLEFDDLLLKVNTLGEGLIQGESESLQQYSKDLDLAALGFSKLREDLALPSALMPGGDPVVEADWFAFKMLANDFKDSNIKEWGVSDSGRIREIQVSISSQRELPIIASLSQLEHLAIYSICEHIDGKLDCTALGDLEKLQRLTLNDGEVADLLFLQKLNGLTNLTLEMLELTSLAPVENLTQLTDLSLGWNPINDLIAISGLTRLRELNLSGCNSIADLSPLVALSALECLIIPLDAEHNLEFLLNLPALRYVEVSTTMAIPETNDRILMELRERGVEVDIS